MTLPILLGGLNCRGRGIADFYAHSLENRPTTEWEPMETHEKCVARLCRLFLRRIDARLASWGEPLGRWHDLGKYLREFRKKIESGESIPSDLEFNRRYAFFTRMLFSVLVDADRLATAEFYAKA